MSHSLERKVSGYVLIGLCLVSTAAAGISINAGETVSIDFAGFTGAGFSPGGATAGTLDSEAWAVDGLSDGSSLFGATNLGGDYGRGADQDGGVGTGGVYAFDPGDGSTLLGVQPGGSDFTPGSFYLKLDLGAASGTVADWSIAYDLWVNNDQARSNSFNLSFAVVSAALTDPTSGVTFSGIPALDFSSAAVADGLGFQSTTQSTNLVASVGAGESLLLRWTSDDVGGSGSRDEFALGGLSIMAHGGSLAVPEPSVIYPLTALALGLLVLRRRRS